MGDDLADRPCLAERALPPGVGWHRVDGLEVPARRLSEPAGLSFHLGYLSAGAGSRVRAARRFGLSSTPSLPLEGPPYPNFGPPPCVLRSVSQVQLFVGDKEAWDGPSAIRVGRRIHHGLCDRRIHSESAGAGRARYRLPGTGGGRSNPYQR